MAGRELLPDGAGRARVGGLLWHLALCGAVVSLLFAVVWALLSSFRPTSRIYGLTPSWPTLEHYTRVLAEWPVATLVGNTFVMASAVAVGQVVIGCLAAFALVHLTPRARRPVLALLTVSLAIPPQALIIPQYLMATRLGWLNTEAGLIVPQLGSSALAVLVLVQHVRAMPVSAAQAARLEGALPREVLWYVVLPALRPAIAAVAVLVFITTWNEYLWPLLITPRTEDTTVQIGLSQFVTAEGTDYGGLLAASTLTSLPILLVYLVAARRITDAFMQAGAR
ncbi:carbohydrate ABC transporter permease [Desertihabitans aurantiacus]|uniref:carbohydrate ABC transporter permease n=1 Tax=Desertihabitans aurantiacus TaxID=2282477 RepID=UPI0018E566B6|nr:carbohydrate ABC transporter permease [Desertihabitans aurantiacus]